MTNKGNRGIQGIRIIRHSRNLLSGIQAFASSFDFCLYVFVFSGGYEGACPLIVLSVIPEIFNRESMLLLFPLIFKCCGPRLKNCRGDDEVGIHAFAFSFGFCLYAFVFSGVYKGDLSPL